MTLDGDLGEPAQAAQLAVLEQQLAEAAEPAALLALATEVDRLGGQLVSELARLRDQPELRSPLAAVLLRVQEVYAKTLLRTAERFDDVGSPRRGAYVLIEVLRRAIDPDVLAMTIDALAFTLEAHGQDVAATYVRGLAALALPATGEDIPARRARRARYLDLIDTLPDHIAWTDLDDELGVD